MQTYIGVKTIKAEPQTCQKDVHNSKVGDPGYKVVYPDGYESWSPKGVFEESYRVTAGMTFGLALEAMEKGFKVRLAMWNIGSYLFLDKSDPCLVCIKICIGGSSKLWLIDTPWEQRELLSDTWEIYEN